LAIGHWRLAIDPTGGSDQYPPPSSAGKNHATIGIGLEGEQQVLLPAAAIKAALRDKPLLGGLLAVGAGYAPRATDHLRRPPQDISGARLVYCLKGGGWCELAGQLHTVRAGDLLVLPPDVPHTCGAHVSKPWTIHWAPATGGNIHDYLSELGVSTRASLVRMGEDLLRIHRSRQLLRSSAQNVKEIATRLGYQDQFHFSGQFKAFQGVSSSEYRDALSG
jgi:AraC-like ligand binding domain/Helix-turn-helix domain